MSDELLPGMVRIKCGIYNQQVPNMVGRQVGEMKVRLRDIFNIAEDAQMRVNGAQVDATHQLQDGDTLEFVRPQGEKAGDGLLTVKYGSQVNRFPNLVGKGLATVLHTLNGIYQITPKLFLKVNGGVGFYVESAQANNRIIQDGDVIEFIVTNATQGESVKQSPDQPITPAYLEIRLGDIQSAIKTDMRAMKSEVVGAVKAALVTAPHQAAAPPAAPRGPSLWKSLLLLSIVSAFGLTGFKTYKEMEFTANFDKYIDATKQAKDPERAKKYADRAVCWLENRGMTDGRTDAFLDGGPEADIQEWYQDVKLVTQAPKAAGDLPPPPQGFFQSVALYPFNKEFFLWVIGTVGTFVVSLFGWLIGLLRS